MIEHIKHLFKAIHKANKDEIEEIKSLKLTEEDEKQAATIATLVVSALAAYGIVIGVAAQPILKKAIAYGLRDLKDGAKTPEKLLLHRIINEVKKAHNDELK